MFGLISKRTAQLQTQLAESQARNVVLSERSSTFTNPDAALLRALEAVGLLGTSNDSGIRVDERAAFGIPAFTRGVNLIGDQLAMFGMKRYVKTNTGAGRVQDDVLAKPNEWQTQFDWIKWMATSMLVKGNGCSRIIRDRFYKEEAYIPIAAKHVQPIMVDNRLHYKINCPGHPEMVHHSEMIHWKGLCFDSMIWGMGVVEYHAQTLGINLAAQKAQARSNKTNSKKALITGTAGKDLKTQAVSLKQNFKAALNGEDDAIVIPNEVKVDWLTMTPAEAQFIETQDYGAVEIARMLGIPASFLDVKDNGNKGSEESDFIKLISNCLQPLATKFEQELAAKTILNPMEYYKFNFNSLMRATALDRGTFYNNAIMYGRMTPNEARELEEMVKLDGGDETYMQMNLIPLNKFEPFIDAKIVSLEKTATNNPTGENANTEN